MIERQTEMETGREKGVWTQVWDEAATGYVTLPLALPTLRYLSTYILVPKVPTVMSWLSFGAVSLARMCGLRKGNR